jgi:hypothetical protein
MNPSSHINPRSIRVIFQRLFHALFQAVAAARRVPLFCGLPVEPAIRWNAYKFTAVLWTPKLLYGSESIAPNNLLASEAVTRSVSYRASEDVFTVARISNWTSPSSPLIVISRFILSPLVVRKPFSVCIGLDPEARSVFRELERLAGIPSISPSPAELVPIFP